MFLELMAVLFFYVAGIVFFYWRYDKVFILSRKWLLYPYLAVWPISFWLFKREVKIKIEKIKDLMAYLEEKEKTSNNTKQLCSIASAKPILTKEIERLRRV